MSDILQYEDLRISFLGHSGFVLNKGESSVVIDPFLTNAPMATQKPESIKATDTISPEVSSANKSI